MGKVEQQEAIKKAQTPEDCFLEQRKRNGGRKQPPQQAWKANTQNKFVVLDKQVEDNGEQHKEVQEATLDQNNKQSTKEWVKDTFPANYKKTEPQAAKEEDSKNDNTSINKEEGYSGANIRNDKKGEGSFVSQNYNMETSYTATNEPDAAQTSPADRNEHKVDDGSSILEDMTKGLDDEEGLVDTIIEVSKAGDVSPRQYDCLNKKKGRTSIPLQV